MIPNKGLRTIRRSGQTLDLSGLHTLTLATLQGSHKKGATVSLCSNNPLTVKLTNPTPKEPSE